MEDQLNTLERNDLTEDWRDLERDVHSARSATHRLEQMMCGRRGDSKSIRFLCGALNWESIFLDEKGTPPCTHQCVPAGAVPPGLEGSALDPLKTNLHAPRLPHHDFVGEVGCSDGEPPLIDAAEHDHLSALFISCLIARRQKEGEEQHE